jgi:hypothetical protein
MFHYQFLVDLNSSGIKVALYYDECRFAQQINLAQADGVPASSPHGHCSTRSVKFALLFVTGVTHWVTPVFYV